MVEASNKADLLEAVEKDQYEVRSADETGGVTLASMATCEHSQVIEKDGSVLGMFIRNELKEVINNRPLRNRTMGGVEGR